MPRPDWEPLKEWLYQQTANEEDESHWWLWWNFLDELTSGYLAYHPLDGHLDPKVLMEHVFWIIGRRRGEGRYWSFAIRPAEELVTVHYGLKDAIRGLSSEIIHCSDALDRIKVLDRQSLAGVSIGVTGDGKPSLILYYLPLFTVRQAMGYLAHTVQIDDEAAKTRSW